jgi:hypothetical protein
MWQPISTAPVNCDLELTVIDQAGEHTLAFPCRRISDGWIDAITMNRLDFRPTHWREWSGKATARRLH